VQSIPRDLGTLRPMPGPGIASEQSQRLLGKRASRVAEPVRLVGQAPGHAAAWGLQLPGDSLSPVSEVAVSMPRRG
jgi:hypothetical protein